MNTCEEAWGFVCAHLSVLSILSILFFPQKSQQRKVSFFPLLGHTTFAFLSVFFSFLNDREFFHNSIFHDINKMKSLGGRKPKFAGNREGWSGSVPDPQSMPCPWAEEKVPSCLKPDICKAVWEIWIPNSYQNTKLRFFLHIFTSHVPQEVPQSI